MIIAIIPARGGSKRLPGKNIKDLAGKPMIAWTIEAAIQSDIFDHVLVSTDDEEIANISKAFGASVPFLRPTEISTDHATTNDVVTHMVDWIENKYEQAVSIVTILQPTSPLRTAADIAQAFELMMDKSAKAVVSVCDLEHPIQFCNKLGADGCMDGFIDPKDTKRTQELEAYYRLNGAIYILDKSYVGHLANIYSSGTHAYIMDRKASIDIDTQDDFELAEYFISSQ
ncbi:pseudaminic acid cytidylyltransferase [Psychrobacter sp. NG27]|uniref:pseudaminic acid cytidylyltransferase n=1 Tax=Psychrobacter sp. NG27 TaxID=2781966 RepID=UPI0018DF2E80|nr:pseudaminic acid cytidylyltransferase [Psychrobacter sp. NG27]MBI0425352.1 pseudaminic acid cytidylyltransferase [Psychrobacter sp. NG27]